MTAVTGQPRGRTEVVLRVALVLVLLGLAAHGLSGRRHLDWAALSDSSGSTWIALVLIALAAFVVAMAVRALLKLVREAPGADDEEGPEFGKRSLPWYTYPAAILVVAVTLVLVYLLVHSATKGPEFRNPGRTVPGPPPPPSPHDLASSIDRPALLLAVVAGVALALTVSLAAVRRRAERDRDLADDERDTDPDATALAAAVAAAEQVLDSHGDDTRAAIIAAYQAMERQLVFSGTTRRASDTPTDFLRRAVESAHVSRGSATRLTDLFREARFSTHPMPRGAREDAARALARVADDLAQPGVRPHA